MSMMVSECATQSSPLHPQHGHYDRYRVTLRAIACAGVALLLAASRSTAQRPTIWIDALASSARPPADVVDQTAGVYGLFGGRATWAGGGRSMDVGTYFGLGGRPEDGRWGSLVATGRQTWKAGKTTGAAELELLGYHYTDPVRYTAGVATFHPTIAHPLGRVTAGGFLDVSFGGWSSPLP